MDIKGLNIYGLEAKPLIIAGPCSAESREQVLTTALELSKAGVKIFRAGAWKPRTKPGCFEGVGEEALSWLAEVRQKTGMYVATEVATPAHVEAIKKWNINLVWVGARTVTNPFAMQELASSLSAANIPVLVKNPVNPDLELWIGAIERLYNAGVKNIGAIHRGFSSYERKIYRNEPLWHIPIELMRRFPNMTILCDPSHIGGKRELIAPISQQAMDMCFKGLIIESHCCPNCALSDAEQQITPNALKIILNNLILRENENITEDISLWRAQIDELDEQLLSILSRRMSISHKIGEYKRKNNIPVLQSERYIELLDNRSKIGESLELSDAFVSRIMKAIHEESVKIQLDI